VYEGERDWIEFRGAVEDVPNTSPSSPTVLLKIGISTIHTLSGAGNGGASK
jgi:hypothetical protein